MGKLKLLGQAEIYYQGKKLELRASKPLYLLIYAAIVGDWIDRDKLAFMFWPNTSAVKSQQNLRRLIYRAKEFEFTSDLEVEKYRLRWLIKTDISEFREALIKQDWQEAIGLYQGMFLEGINPKNEVAFETWLEQERADLERAWRNALHKHVATLETQAKHSEAAPLLLQLFNAEPLAEDVLQRYLRSAYLAGERDSALAVFETFKRLLKNELDLDPLEDSLKLIEVIRNRTKLEPVTSSVAQIISGQEKMPKLEPIPLSVLRPPKLIGRDDTINKIRNASTPVIFIAGEAGIGKSRLMNEVAPNALLISCQEGLQNIPYYPMIRLIRSLIEDSIQTPDLKHYLDDLVRLVPEVSPAITPGPADLETGRSRLFEALSRYLEHVVNLKKLNHIQLLIDDLQWSDSSTLDFLIYLSNKQNIKILASYRIHEKTDSLNNTIKGLNSSQLLTEVKLEPLTQATLQDFIATLMGTPDGLPIFSEWLFKGTAGNPMFILETLKSLFETGTLKAKGNSWETDIDEITQNYSEIQTPTVIQDVIQRRIEKLKPQTQRVLQVASVISQGFTPELVTQISGFSEWAVLEAFEEAENTAIIEQDRFQHDLLRQSIYEQLTSSRKSLLHLKIAKESAEFLPIDVIAEHWFQANHLSNAIICWEKIAETLTEQGLIQEAISTLQRAFNNATNAETKHRLSIDLSTAYLDLGDFETTINLAEEVLNEVVSPAIRASALCNIANGMFFRGEIKKAESIAQEAFLLAKTCQEKSPLKEAMSILGILCNAQGNYWDALKFHQGVLELDRKNAKPLHLITSLNNLARTYDILEQHKEALPYYDEALELAQSIGAKQDIVTIATNLLLCYLDQNNSEKALNIAKVGLSLGRYGKTDSLRNNYSALLFEIGQYTEALIETETLINDSTEPTLLAIAWNRIVKIHHHQNQEQLIPNALVKALEYTSQTEHIMARVNVGISVLDFGTREQVDFVMPWLEAVKIETLPSHVRLRLQKALP